MRPRVKVRSPQQILAQLAELRRNWLGVERSEGVCDILLDEMLTVRPDLKEMRRP
jgi:hypothetical protein